MTRIFSISLKPRGWQSGSRVRGESSVPRGRKNTIGGSAPAPDDWRGGKKIIAGVPGGAPEVPWKLIAGTRDKLIHFYEGVDLEEVWKMVTSDLPELIRQIAPMCQPLLEG